MEAIYLQSMTDFVLKVVQTPNVNEAICWEQTEERLNKIYQYSLFLKQPLQLGFFVNTDKNGNILKGKPLSPATDSEWIRWENEEFEFYEARERVLFKGFEIRDKGNFYFVERKESTLFRRVLSKNTKSTIEDLLIWGNVELTETAIKQIGL